MKSPMRFALPLLVALLAALVPPASAQAPAPERLETLLQRMQATQQSIKTLRVSFVQTNAFKMLSRPVELRGDLVLQKPVTALYRYTSPQKLFYLVKDGDLLMYDPVRKQAFLQDISRHQAKISRYLGISEPVDELRKNFEIRWEAEKNGVVTLRLDPKKSRVKKKVASMMFRVQEKDGLLKEFEVEELEGDRIRFAFTGWELNPVLGPDAFRVDLPPGTKVERKLMNFREPFQN
jgi:outer membrane lipoprotein-sorting protein